MRRLLLVPLLLIAGSAHAEDSVTLWGNYYKERSTRVYEPMVKITKDLPYDAQADVTYLVDQVTSASGAFTPTDSAFQEYRQEFRLSARKKFLRMLTPGASFRVSYEPDYTSYTYGTDLALSLFHDATVLRAYAQYQQDDVRQRSRPSFADDLKTTLVGLAWTQVLRKDAIAGLSLETQLLRGYMENPYRVENHPRRRNRYTAALWGAYQYTPTRTTGRLAYRFYADDWDLVGHSVEAELTQRVIPEIEVAARFRTYTQGNVYFTTINDGFLTSDPKLFAFNSRLYGVQLRWTLDLLRGTFLEPFSESRIEPSYALLDQDNAYGIAHIAELGWYWPF